MCAGAVEKLRKIYLGASLVVHWLRSHLAMQETLGLFTGLEGSRMLQLSPGATTTEPLF